MNDVCIFCETGKTNFFSQRANDGYYCKECANKISAFIDTKTSTTKSIKALIKFNEKRRKSFKATSSFGNLYLDSVNKMICISKGGTSDNPFHLCDIYSIYDLKQISFHCVNVRNIGQKTDNIVCDVEIFFATDFITGRSIIVKNEPCNFTYNNNRQIEYSEPVKLGVFRNIFNQMIEDEKFKIENKLEDIRKGMKQINNESGAVDWAKGVLMLDKGNNYTDREIKEHRNYLMKALHPDTNNVPVEFSQMVNKAFKILSTKE